MWSYKFNGGSRYFRMTDSESSLNVSSLNEDEQEEVMRDTMAQLNRFVSLM